MILFEADIEVILLLLLLGVFQKLLRSFGLVGGGVSIHDTHVVNTVCPLGPQIPDQKVPHIAPLLQRQ